MPIFEKINQLLTIDFGIRSCKGFSDHIRQENNLRNDISNKYTVVCVLG